MANFEQLMRKREGVKLEVYLDSLKKPTVGIGHLVTKEDSLKVGDKITEQQVSAFFKKDSAKAVAASRRQAGMAGIKSAEFVVYLSSVNFQLGTHWYKRKFRKTWQMIMDGKYEEAATAIQSTAWFRQTPVRVKDFQRALRKLPAKAGADATPA